MPLYYRFSLEEGDHHELTFNFDPDDVFNDELDSLSSFSDGTFFFSAFSTYYETELIDKMTRFYQLADRRLVLMIEYLFEYVAAFDALKDEHYIDQRKALFSLFSQVARSSIGEIPYDPSEIWPAVASILSRADGFKELVVLHCIISNFYGREGANDFVARCHAFFASDPKKWVSIFVHENFLTYCEDDAQRDDSQQQSVSYRKMENVHLYNQFYRLYPEPIEIRGFFGLEDPRFYSNKIDTNNNNLRRQIFKKIQSIFFLPLADRIRYASSAASRSEYYHLVNFWNYNSEAELRGIPMIYKETDDLNAARLRRLTCEIEPPETVIITDGEPWMNEQQRINFSAILNSGLSFLSGCPGVGKSYTGIFSVCKYLLDKGTIKPEEVILLAPTGKAVSILMKSLSTFGMSEPAPTPVAEAVAISSLEEGTAVVTEAEIVEVDPLYIKSYSRFGLEPPLKATKKDYNIALSGTIHRIHGHLKSVESVAEKMENMVLVIDEMSFVGTMGMKRILDVIDMLRDKYCLNGKMKHIIFSGDPNQLSSIEYGSVYHSIVFSKSMQPYMRKYDKIERQTAVDNENGRPAALKMAIQHLKAAMDSPVSGPTRLSSRQFDDESFRIHPVETYQSRGARNIDRDLFLYEKRDIFTAYRETFIPSTEPAPLVICGTNDDVNQWNVILQEEWSKIMGEKETVTVSASRFTSSFYKWDKLIRIRNSMALGHLRANGEDAIIVSSGWCVDTSPKLQDLIFQIACPSDPDTIEEINGAASFLDLFVPHNAVNGYFVYDKPLIMKEIGPAKLAKMVTRAYMASIGAHILMGAGRAKRGTPKAPNILPFLDIIKGTEDVDGAIEDFLSTANPSKTQKTISKYFKASRTGNDAVKTWSAKFDRDELAKRICDALSGGGNIEPPRLIHVLFARNRRERQRNIEVEYMADGVREILTESMLRKDFKLAYSITSHKAQGSTTLSVIFWISTFFSLSLIYVAISRATKKVRILNAQNCSEIREFSKNMRACVTISTFLNCGVREKNNPTWVASCEECGLKTYAPHPPNKETFYAKKIPPCSCLQSSNRKRIAEVC